VRVLTINAGSSNLKLRLLDDDTALLPGVPAVACFDTAFHAGVRTAASTYAIPREWRERHGFHGLNRPRAGLRVVTCHQGAGASLAAVIDGRSAVERLSFLGAALDPDRNHSARGDTDVTTAGSVARPLVITAREDLQIAQKTRALCAVPVSNGRSR
jgi:acetate kinase